MKQLSLLISTCLFAISVLAEPLPKASPERLGFDAARLAKMRSMVQKYISEGKHAGAISLIVRNGKVADLATYGYRDLAKREPMTPDTIVRIYSMSKIITSAAALSLIEEARLTLDTPVTNYIPEFVNLRVLTGGTAENPTLEDVKKVMTVKHLLTHTAGFGYEFSGSEALRKLYAKADMWNESVNFKEFIRRLAKLPLAHQPGETFTYGVNTDVLGYLVQVVSGQPLEEFLQQRVFTPLKMTDTGFDVPAEKISRLAKLYENGPDGALREVPKAPYGTYAEAGKGFPSGGGGLFSTARDYFRFGQMLLNGGELDGNRVLGRKTVELMTVNHLTFLEKGTLDPRGSEGFGLGGSVKLDLSKGNTLGSVGQFGWNGAATTTFSIDPREKTVALLLVQHLPYNQHGIFEKFHTLFYHSLE